jgi:hypothetical protein
MFVRTRRGTAVFDNASNVVAIVSIAAEHVLLPILDLLAHGPPRADGAGRLLLSAASLWLWQEALRNAPAAAIALCRACVFVTSAIPATAWFGVRHRISRELRATGWAGQP